MSSIALPLVFDNDCLSSFLWTRRGDIIQRLYDQNMIVPDIVKGELEYLRKFKNYAFVCEELDQLVKGNNIIMEIMPAIGPLADKYRGLENGSIIGKNLGKGESAAIAIAQKIPGTLASNNLSDVEKYCKDNNITYVCTDNILYEALSNGIITLDEGQQIWKEMKSRKRLLPSYDFYESVRRFEKGIGR